MPQNKLRIIVMIPARMKSNRLPGKVLMDIQGKTMLQRVHEKAVSFFDKEDVYIATDAEEVKRSAEAFRAQVIMTSEDHQSGTQRIAEAVTKLDLADNDIVVNLQGDEPQIPGSLVRLVAANLFSRENTEIATLYVPITSEAEFYNPNSVKVVTDKDDNALYFSREPIPHHGFKEGIAKRHIGIYAYRVRTLRKIATCGHPKIEDAERLEQLQTLYEGGVIHVGLAPYGAPPGVDTPEDLWAARRSTLD